MAIHAHYGDSNDVKFNALVLEIELWLNRTKLSTTAPSCKGFLQKCKIRQLMSESN